MEGTNSQSDAERARMEEHQRRMASAHHTATGGAPVASPPAAPAAEPRRPDPNGAGHGRRPAPEVARGVERHARGLAIQEIERLSAALAGCLTADGELLRPRWRDDATVRLLLALADAVLALADADPDGAP